ncbi:MAG TPA: hypothetical protein V6C97_21485 [Oculatellaceae cyanobacterium]
MCGVCVGGYLPVVRLLFHDGRIGSLSVCLSVCLCVCVLYVLYRPDPLLCHLQSAMSTLQQLQSQVALRRRRDELGNDEDTDDGLSSAHE